MPDVSTLTLNNGVELPALGLGVFQTPAEETRAAVEAALSAGCSVRPPGGARRRQGRQQPAPAVNIRSGTWSGRGGRRTQ
jgi:hypothetical protein